MPDNELKMTKDDWKNSRLLLQTNRIFIKRIIKLRDDIEFRKNTYFKAVDMTPEQRSYEIAAIGEAMKILNKLTHKLEMEGL